jgi:hypothetical protein
MAKTKPTQEKAALYKVIAKINRDFERVIADLEQLQALGFRKERMTAFSVKVEELRSWVNSELLETQHDRELTDWARFGRLNRRWQKRYQDPNDVVLEAAKR